MMGRKIYVASSWRNERQPIVVDALRKFGHQVYDFRNPSVGYDNPTGVTRGFAWSDIDPAWESWDREAYLQALWHPTAQLGFASDFHAMRWADAGVLLLPSGRSAHLEAGWFAQPGKELHVLLERDQEPELMYLMATSISRSIAELATWLNPETRAIVMGEGR